MARFTAFLAILALAVAAYNLTLLSGHLRGMQQRVASGEGAPGGGIRSRPNDPRLPSLDVVDPHDSFSACLLWMDDNFRLPEWIAYHYYMMNLRYLVIHPDPSSKTSPAPMLDRWRDRITIVEWSNTSIFSNKTYHLGKDLEGEGKPISDAIRHRSGAFLHRQVDFFKSCAMHLKAEGKKWASFHDSDEFIVVTPQANVSRQEINRPGIIPRIVNRYSRELWAKTRASEYNFSDFQQFQDWNLWFSARPCVVLPRALFSAINSTDEEVSKDVPPFLDAKRFETLAWRHQGTEMRRSDGPGKAIIDVSRLPDDAPDRTGETETAHRPFGDFCTHSWPIANGLPLLIHHYLGTWEAFSYRDDARKGLARTIEKWRDQAQLNLGGVNDEARAWIRGFVAMVGEERAKQLLKGAGLPRGYKKTENETAEWSLKGSDKWIFR
jgi:hypothetical protein